MTFVSTLDRYIARVVLTSTLLVFGVILALLIFIFVIDSMPEYGRGNFFAYELAKFVLLSQPRRIYEVLPVMALIGTTIGLSTLALSSELTAMRAAGMAAGRIVYAALKVGALFAVIGVLLGEFIVPVSEDLAQTERASALQVGLHQHRSGVWLRDGAQFVNIGEVLPDKTLLRLKIYGFDQNGQLREQLSAARARFSQDAWQLEEVRRVAVGFEGVKVTTERLLPWYSEIAPNVVEVFARRPESLSAVQLWRYIDHLRQNGLDTTRFRLSFWQKIFAPIATLVMVLLATPFVFGPVRSGGMGQRLFVGIVIGILFMVMARLFGLLGVVYGMPPLLSAALPVALFFGVAILLLRRVT